MTSTMHEFIATSRSIYGPVTLAVLAVAAFFVSRKYAGRAASNLAPRTVLAERLNRLVGHGRPVSGVPP